MWGCGAERKVWWKCLSGHEWEASIKSRNKGHGCPICGTQKMVEKKQKDSLKKYGNIIEKCPVLAKQWNYEKNIDINPKEISPKSGLIVWWKCDVCNHEWEKAVNYRNRGIGCPECAKKKRGKSISEAKRKKVKI